VNLEPYWEKSLAELPGELREIVRTFLTPWDESSVTDRQRLCKQHDRANDPKLEPSLYFALGHFDGELKGRIEKARQEGKADSALELLDVSNWIKKTLKSDRGIVGAEIQQLRRVAREANEHIGKIEEARAGRKPSGMHFEQGLMIWQLRR
jgi:hypothetical protein